jgi:hypothetical protein
MYGAGKRRYQEGMHAVATSHVLQLLCIYMCFYSYNNVLANAVFD